MRNFYIYLGLQLAYAVLAAVCVAFGIFFLSAGAVPSACLSFGVATFEALWFLRLKEPSL